jgi:hypothetical protein
MRGYGVGRHELRPRHALDVADPPDERFDESCERLGGRGDEPPHALAAWLTRNGNGDGRSEAVEDAEDQP